MDYPISNQAYDLLSILDSKLEGLKAYDEYLKDLQGEFKTLLDQIRSDDRRHAEMLANAIERMAKNGGLAKK